MAKLTKALFGLNARGTLGKALSFRRRGRETIAEKKPIPEDAKSLTQLSWRHMYQKAAALWHALSAEEKEDWESQARSRHMTGFAWFMSQCLKPNPGIYLPLQGGTMSGDIDMAKHKILKLPLPTDDQEAATKKYVDTVAPPAASKIVDADGDTSLDVEQAADEDKIHGKVKGVEAFLLDDTGVLTLARQSGCKVYLATANQSIPTHTLTKVELNAKIYDVQAEFDPVTNYRFTAKTAGYYLAVAVGYMILDDGQLLSIIIQKNGATISDTSLQAALTPSYLRPQNANVVGIAVGDYLEFHVYHTYGANRDLEFGVGNTSFTIQKIA